MLHSPPLGLLDGDRGCHAVRFSAGHVSCGSNPTASPPLRAHWAAWQLRRQIRHDGKQGTGRQGGS